MRRVHWILSGLSLTIILLTLNRLTSLTAGYLQPFEFLRWLDFHAMLTIPLASIVLYYLLKREVAVKTPVLLGILLVVGIYLFGAGSGDHEVTNYLNTRFCLTNRLQPSVCKIISYNDDEFSHYVYYAGFIAINVALMLLEYGQLRVKGMTKKDLILVSVNGLFIAAGIFANLALEETGVDIPIFASVMIFALYLLYSRKSEWQKLPVTYYFALSYTVGVLGTLLYKLVH